MHSTQHPHPELTEPLYVIFDARCGTYWAERIGERTMQLSQARRFPRGHALEIAADQSRSDRPTVLPILLIDAEAVLRMQEAEARERDALAGAESMGERRALA